MSPFPNCSLLSPDTLVLHALYKVELFRLNSGISTRGEELQIISSVYRMKKLSLVRSRNTLWSHGRKGESWDSWQDCPGLSALAWHWVSLLSLSSCCGCSECHTVCTQLLPLGVSLISSTPGCSEVRDPAFTHFSGLKSQGSQQASGEFVCINAPRPTLSALRCADFSVYTLRSQETTGVSQSRDMYKAKSEVQRN